MPPNAWTGVANVNRVDDGVSPKLLSPTIVSQNLSAATPSTDPLSVVIVRPAAKVVSLKSSNTLKGAGKRAGAVITVIDDPTAVETTGRRFRETVLALGGGAPPSEVFEAFRGRGPRPDALLRHSGLGPEIAPQGAT